MINSKNTITSVYDEPVSRLKSLQIIFYLLTRCYFFLSRSKIIAIESWASDTRRNYVYAANHLSFLDSFIVGSASGFKNFTALLPYRFMTTPKYLAKPYIGRLMRLLGAFPSHPMDGQPFGLDASFELMRRGQTIIIFPQGRRTKDRQSRVYNGVSELSRYNNTFIVPILMEKSARVYWPTYKVIIGAPFDGSALTAQEIMDRIYELETHVQ